MTWVARSRWARWAAPSSTSSRAPTTRPTGCVWPAARRPCACRRRASAGASRSGAASSPPSTAPWSTRARRRTRGTPSSLGLPLEGSSPCARAPAPPAAPRLWVGSSSRSSRAPASCSIASSPTRRTSRRSRPMIPIWPPRWPAVAVAAASPACRRRRCPLLRHRAPAEGGLVVSSARRRRRRSLPGAGASPRSWRASTRPVLRYRPSSTSEEKGWLMVLLCSWTRNVAFWNWGSLQYNNGQEDTYLCAGLLTRPVSMRPRVFIRLNVGKWKVLQNVIVLVAAAGLPNIAFMCLCSVMQSIASGCWNLKWQHFD